MTKLFVLTATVDAWEDSACAVLGVYSTEAKANASIEQIKARNEALRNDYRAFQDAKEAYVNAKLAERGWTAGSDSCSLRYAGDLRVAYYAEHKAPPHPFDDRAEFEVIEVELDTPIETAISRSI